MAALLFCLVVLSVVDYGMFQSPVDVTPAAVPGCASRSGYIRGSDKCCNRFVFASLYQICCTDPQQNVCYCDGNHFGTVCAAVPMSTPSPAGPPILCPGGQSVPQGRLLRGTTVTEACSARGVVGLTVAGTQFCNAPYVHDPVTGDKVLYTLTSCWQAALQSRNSGFSVTGAIFGDSFPVDNCTVVASPAAANPNITMLSLSKLTSYFVEQHLAECPSPGCLYNSTTMNTAVNFSDCFVVSYGFDLAGSTELRRVSVKMGDATRCANAVPGSQCFVSDQGGSPCLGDGGAPVYCSLNTGEVALYGISASPNRCSPSVTSFSMFPLSP